MILKRSAQSACFRGIGFACLVSALPSLAPQARAIELVNWNFTGLTGEIISAQGAYNPTGGFYDNRPASGPLGDRLGVMLDATRAAAATGLSCSALQGNAGLLFSNGYANGTAINDEINLKQWDLPSGTGNGSNDNYFYFVLTADTGKVLNLEALAVRVWRNGSGAPDGIAFEVVVDGGPPTLFAPVQTATATGLASKATYTFNGSITNARTIEIRYAPRKVSAGSTGNHHLDLLTASGSLSADPNPPFPPGFLKLEPTAPGFLGLRFTAGTGFTYQIEASPDLSDGSWQDFGSPVTGDDVEHVVPVTAAPSNRFFRIRREANSP